jgi:hypothetical protein
MRFLLYAPPKKKSEYTVQGQLTGFLTKMEDVYYAVRTGSLNETDSVSTLKDILSTRLSRL